MATVTAQFVGGIPDFYASRPRPGALRALGRRDGWPRPRPAGRGRCSSSPPAPAWSVAASPTASLGARLAVTDLNLPMLEVAAARSTTTRG